MKKIALPLALLLCAVSLLSLHAKRFLHEIPKGQLSDELLANKKGLDALLIGTYSMLKGKGGDWISGCSNWLHGSIRAATPILVLITTLLCLSNFTKLTQRVAFRIQNGAPVTKASVAPMRRSGFIYHAGCGTYFRRQGAHFGRSAV